MPPYLPLYYLTDSAKPNAMAFRQRPIAPLSRRIISPNIKYILFGELGAIVFLANLDARGLECTVASLVVLVLLMRSPAEVGRLIVETVAVQVPASLSRWTGADEGEQDEVMDFLRGRVALLGVLVTPDVYGNPLATGARMCLDVLVKFVPNTGLATRSGRFPVRPDCAVLTSEEPIVAGDSAVLY